MMLAVNPSPPVPDVSKTKNDDQAREWLRLIARDRSKQAFEQLYKLYAPKIKHYMLRQGAEAAAAEDLSQETMVQIWRKAEQYSPDKAAPSAWIYRIARNLRIDKLRRQKFHEVELNDAVHVDTPERAQTDESESSLDARHLSESMADLPGEQRDILHLAYYRGLSQSEISQHLDIPLGTVKSRLRLAFGRLKTAMGDVR